MTDLCKAAEMALKALEKYEDEWLDDGRRIYVDAELDALRQALEQYNPSFDRTASHMAGEYVDTAQQEPVAWVCLDLWKTGKHWPDDCFGIEGGEGMTPLYTAPPKREFIGLTDEEIKTIEVEYPDKSS